MSNRIAIATQMDETLVEAVTTMARHQGRAVDAVIEDAVRSFVNKPAVEAPGPAEARPHVMAAFEESVRRFGPLYERLAR